MGSHQEKFSVSRLVGAPPGYVGYDEGGQLTEAVRRKPYSVILFDEIEKAHPDVFNVLLQVLDDGRLTDNKGRVVNFKNTIIIMTSNAGSAYIQELYNSNNNTLTPQQEEDAQHQIMEILKVNMRPEFLNRIDDILLFHPLDKNAIKQIVKLQIKDIVNRLKEQDIHLQVTDDIVTMIAAEGYDPEFGARPVKRALQKLLTNGLSKALLKGNIDKTQPILSKVVDKEIVFSNI